MRLMLTTLPLVPLVALSACATVPPGHAGVLLRTSGVDAKTLPEGVSFIGPLDRVKTYDLRAQERTEDLKALSADGAVLEARASVMTFHPAPSEVVALAREVGPDYYKTIVKPMVRSVLRKVIAGFRADQLDTPGIGRAQREVTEETARRLRPYHIVFDGISLRTLGITRSSEAYRAIVDTSVAEQKALTARELPVLARQHAEETRAEAQGIAEAHALIAPTLTPEILSDAAYRAWSKLLTAPSTQVEVRPNAQPYILEVEP